MSLEIPLAKPPETGLTLEEHSCQVAEYLRELLEAYRSWLKDLLPDVDALIEEMLWAAKVHDLGKATEGFQRFLSSKVPWGFRHEVLSLALLGQETFSDPQKFYALSAVLTHHKNIDDEHLLASTGANRAAYFLKEINNKQKQVAQEITPYLEWLRKYLKELNLNCQAPDFKEVKKFHEYLLKETDKCKVLEKKGLTLTLARGALMAADHATSFGVKHFLKDLPKPKCSSFPRPFQLKAGEHEGHLILEAPTGAGKTEAALRWLNRNRKAGERIFYLLPNRASIHAMYHTLAEKYFDPKYVGFLHARALNYLFELYESENYEETYFKAKQEKDINFLFYKPLKVLTPYQILKWFFGIKRFEIGFMELLGGLFIFDEIHAYDPHTTALIMEIVSFLSGLGGRFLFMSATIPDFILSEIKKSLPGPQIHLHLDPCDSVEKKILCQARHRVFFRETHLEDLLEEIVGMSKNRRVLVVANRVDQAQAIYQTLREKFDLKKNEIGLLHGRFTYEDRNRKERKLIETLKKKESSLRILVATQVIEVSLDISFEAMFTEIAPVDDLLQRMGRVNRYGKSEAPAEVHIATFYEKTPYDRFYLEKALESKPENGSELNAEKASLWLKKAYESGFSPKDRDTYRRARESFRRLVEDLKPLRGCYEEKYFDLFRIYEILPVSKSSLFEEYIDRGEILKAFQLLVPVPERFWHKLKRDNLLEPFKNRTVLAQVKYDPELGLLSDPEFTGSFL
ncbi:CRISPR-associated helicase Cas3' [Thermosulfurimonas sp. F29]|uniref:CRISPR-associated helicase Cas3' n=1 Tax=Thermosulfurimonas sp. F29 TaxID=2867247 RepID=UPI001C835A5B|nr:CRISPR-associated helicase Cas3' [Thermosulfurimonas sp. F29]MBX6423904.1 CRISPR-associated helicase Cas3' [Thermosulfurimonas sp. F29]